MLQESKDAVRGIIRTIESAMSEIDDNESRSETRDDVVIALEDLMEGAESILRMM